MQSTILEGHPAAGLRVYVVWLPMLWGDSRSAWDGGVMPDARVTQFWDEQTNVGQWFARQVDGYDGTAWDAYYLYGPEARWEAIPAPLVSSGGTIYDERDAVEKQVLALVKP